MRTRATRHAIYLQQTVAEKRLIVDAIAARDSQRAHQATSSHINAALGRVLAALATASTSQAYGKSRAGDTDA